MNPQFYAFNPDYQFDSFVTIGLDGPALTPGALTTVGITFAEWTERNGISTDNGAVFFMVRLYASVCSNTAQLPSQPLMSVLL